MIGLTFAAPGRLWLLVGVIALGVIHVVRSLRGRRYAVRFTNLALLDSVAPDRPAWRRHVPATLMLLGLAGMVLSLAKPASEQRVPRERATIVIAIDTSLSMEATDVAPSRIRAAQDAAKEFVGLLPERINVGLVTFNGTAVVRVPPTQNHDQLLAAIDQIRLGERTAIGEAIYASLDSIRNVGGIAPDDASTTGRSEDPPAGPEDPSREEEDEVPARIVLMSDGSTTVGRPDAEAAAEAKRTGVPVSTIAFGTPGGTIEIEGSPTPVSVAVDRSALEVIANATDGTFFEAATAEQLSEVYRDIGSSIGYTTEERSIAEWFVAGSLAVLALAAVGSQVWFSRLP